MFSKEIFLLSQDLFFQQFIVHILKRYNKLVEIIDLWWKFMNWDYRPDAVEVNLFLRKLHHFRWGNFFLFNSRQDSLNRPKLYYPSVWWSNYIYLREILCIQKWKSLTMQGLESHLCFVLLNLNLNPLTLSISNIK